MNKKGLFSEDAVFMILNLLLLIIVAVFLVFLINLFTVQELDIQRLEAEVLKDRILYSKNCISFYDSEIDRSYPGIIDMEKFSEENLKNCLFFVEENRNIATKLTLLNPNNEEIKTIYYNKEWYDKWLPLIGIPGPGGVKDFSYTLNMIVKTNENNKEKYENSFLNFEIIVPNS